MSEISKDIANFSRDPQESTEKNLQEQMLVALGSLVFKAYGAIVWRGEFNLGTAYKVNDFVSFQNSLYICTQDNTGELLTEGFWDLMIETPSEVEMRVENNNLEWKLESDITWNHLVNLDSLIGPGVSVGGTAGQVLSKKTNTDFDTEWITPKSALAEFAQDTLHRLVSDSLINAWNEAHSWGNHAGLYSLLSHNHDSLYELLGSAQGLLNTHNSNYDHSLIATALQSEADPIFSQWLLSTPPLYSETDPVFTAWDRSTGISITESQISDLKTYIQSSEKGANNGVASLDAGGKVPTTQLPATLLIYKGVWNATTNTPELLATDTTKKGFVYNVAVAGTQFDIDWKLGDWAIYNDDGVLEKSDNSDDVVSVNGQQGVVVLNADHISDTSTTNKFVTIAEKGLWNSKQDALGFTPENVANKKTTLTDSDSDYPTTRAVNTALGSKITWGGDNAASKGLIGTTSNQPIGFITNNTERLTVLKDGNVGIGTTNPGAKLEINQDNTAAGLYVTGGQGGQDMATFVRDIGATGTIGIHSSLGQPQISFRKASNTFSVGTYGGTFRIADNNAIGTNDRLTIDTSGNVGIGTANPGSKLSINDTLTEGQSYLTILDTSNELLSFKKWATNYIEIYSPRNLYFKSGSTGTNQVVFKSGMFQIENPIAVFRGLGGTLEFKTAGGISNDIFFSPKSVEAMRLTSSGLVGIGTATPNQQLEITKNFRLPATVGTDAYGVIYKDGNRFIHDFNYGDNGTVTTAGNNTFIGVNAGNFTMGSTATVASEASYNTGIGVQALNKNTAGANNSAIGAYALRNNTTGGQNSAIGFGALQNNTTGSNNTAIGAYALRNNTTGHNNYAIGVSALLNNTTGYYNTAIGAYALQNNTTGYSNSAIGGRALLNNTTGYSNSAIGREAGSYLSDGTTGRETGNNGLYLGYNSKASADGTDNEIVIGYNAIGKGSNTIKLGNSSILATYTDGEIYKGTEQSKVQGVVFTQTADKTIGNTTTETTMFANGVGSLTIPANSLVVGRTYRIKLKGYASGTNGDTSTLKVKLGSTELVSSTGTWQTLTDIGFTLEFDFTCRTTGTTGTVAGNGYSLVSGGQGFSTVSMRALLAGTDTLNTTVDQVIDLTYQWSSASAGNTITITNASVEVLN